MLERTFCKCKECLRCKPEWCKFVQGKKKNIAVLQFQNCTFKSMIADQCHFTFIWLAAMHKISGGKHCTRLRLFLKGIYVLKILHSDIECGSVASKVPWNVEVFISEALSLCHVIEKLFFFTVCKIWTNSRIVRLRVSISLTGTPTWFLCKKLC